MKKVRKMVVVLLMVFGAVNVSMGVEIKDLSYYKELKAWVEDMKVKYPHLKADDPERIEEYGEYPRLTPFINDLEFLDDLDVEKKKEENKGKQESQIMRKLANSPKWKCNGLCKKKETHYFDSVGNGVRLLLFAKKRAKEDEEKIKYDKDLADAKAGAFREMGGEIRIRKWSE